MAAKKAAKKKPAKKVAKKATAKKASVKKASVKKAVKKTAKKSAKKVVKRTAKSAAASYKVPAVPTRSAATKRISTSPAPVKPAGIAPISSTPAKKKSSSRSVITILAAVALIALLVVSRNGSKTETPATQDSAKPEASMSQSASTESSASAATPQAPSTGHGAPQGIVAHYNANGATIYWTAPAESEGISNYQVEISKDGGAFAVASTVPASQLSLDIAKSDTTGWCSFRVSTIYSDGTVVGGKVFGLPGQWS